MQGRAGIGLQRVYRVRTRQQSRMIDIGPLIHRDIGRQRSVGPASAASGHMLQAQARIDAYANVALPGTNL